MATRRSRFSKRTRKSIAKRRVRVVGEKSQVKQAPLRKMKREQVKNQPVRNYPLRRRAPRKSRPSEDTTTTVTTTTATTTTVSTTSSSTVSTTTTTVVTTTTLAPTTTTTSTTVVTTTTLAPTTTSTTVVTTTTLAPTTTSTSTSTTTSTTSTTTTTVAPTTSTSSTSTTSTTVVTTTTLAPTTTSTSTSTTSTTVVTTTTAAPTTTTLAPTTTSTSTSTTTSTTVVTTTTLAPTTTSTTTSTSTSTTTTLPPTTTTTSTSTTTTLPPTTTTTLAPTTTSTSSTVTTTTSTVTTTTANPLALLLHMNDTGLTDDSPYSHNTSLQGGMGRSATQSKFGGWAAFLDGSDDFIIVTNSQAFNLLSNEFTLEAWVYRTAGASAAETIIGTKNSGTSEGYDLYMNASEVVVFEYHQLGSPHPLRQFTTSIVLGNNAWIHVAIVRDGNTLRAFKNGVASGTFAMPGSTIRGLSTHFYVGAKSGFLSKWSGYIDEVRLLNGEKEWVSDFTPYTRQYAPPVSTTTTTSTSTTSTSTSTTAAPSTTTTTSTSTSTTTTLPPTTTTTLAPTTTSTTTSTSTSTTAAPSTTTSTSTSTTVVTTTTSTTAAGTLLERWGENTADDYNSRSEDTRIIQAAPTNNDGSGTTMNTGSSAGFAQRSLIRFTPKQDIPNATIAWATLRIYTTTREYADHDIEVFRVLQDWVELEASWNSFSTGNSWNTAGCSAANDSGVDDDGSYDRHATAIALATGEVTTPLYIDYDITDLVQEWVDGTTKEYGVVLIGTDEAGNEVDVMFTKENTDGSRPYLTIAYIPAPTTTSTTSTSTTTTSTSTTAAPSTTTTSTTTSTTAAPTTTTIPQFTEIWGNTDEADYNDRIEECSLNENSPNFNNGNVGTITLGHSGDSHRPIWKLHVKNDIFEATIISAKLWLRCSAAPTGGDLTANVYRLLQANKELQSTWNIYSTGNNWNTVGADAANDSGVDDDGSYDRHATKTGGSITFTDDSYTSIDITDIVQDWVDGTHKEYGILMISETEETTDHSCLIGTTEWVESFRPYLEVTYTGGTALSTTTTSTTTTTTT